MAEQPSLNDFGLLIAYVLPGFVALQATAYLPGRFSAWLGPVAADASGVGGFLYLTVGAIAAGVTVGTLRWLVIDTIHHRTGVSRPDWDFSLLAERSAAFGLIVDHYFRYYQCYAGMVISLAFVLAARRWSLGLMVPDAVELGLLILMAVFFVASRDSLRRYYVRGGQLLRERAPVRRRHPGRPLPP